MICGVTALRGANPCLQNETTAFKQIFAMCFPLFIVAALIGRVLQRPLCPVATGQGGKHGLLAEARALADMVVPFAFMA